MKPVHCLWLLFLLYLSPSVHAQYKDLVMYHGRLWCLSKSGSITVFDPTTQKRIIMEIPWSGDNIVLAKDARGDLAVVNSSNEVKIFDSVSWNWKTIAKLNNKVVGLVFNSDNNGYAIIQEGIVDLQTKKVFYQDSSLNHQVHYRGRWAQPSCYYMDRHDCIWIGFGFGEWGGDLFVFDTKTKKFIAPKLNRFDIELFPVKFIFEDAHSVYVSCGLDHMSTSGCIVKFDGYSAHYVLLSDTRREKIEGSNKDSLYYGEYIGPAAFSKRDNSIYFYSQNGIFKGNLDKDLSTLEGWTKLFQPKLKWKWGQRDAVGSPMNVLEMMVLDNGTIVFSSQSDGIGIYRNNKLTMIK